MLDTKVENDNLPDFITPDISDRVAAAYEISKLIESQEIVTAEDYENASEDLMKLKGIAKELDGQRKELVKPLNAEVKSINDYYRRPLDYVSGAERTRKQQISKYLQEEGAKRRAAAEAEAKKIEKLAEQRADRAEKKGDHEKAAIEIATSAQHAAVTRAVAATEAPPKVKGVSQRKTYKAQVVDLMALVKAVAAGEASIVLLAANQTEINKRARALGKEFQAPGILVTEEVGIAARAK